MFKKAFPETEYYDYEESLSQNQLDELRYMGFANKEFFKELYIKAIQTEDDPIIMVIDFFTFIEELMLVYDYNQSKGLQHKITEEEFVNG